MVERRIREKLEEPIFLARSRMRQKVLRLICINDWQHVKRIFTPVLKFSAMRDEGRQRLKELMARLRK